MGSLVLFILVTLNSFSGADTKQFLSPNGLTESCISLPEIPGGNYDSDDKEEEQEFCSLDFYSENTVALCPKTWSTSPGTMIYDITKSGLNRMEYEAQNSCGGSKSGHETICKFKQSMNQSGTSGTYSPSSLLYYHFSRFFDTTAQFPVAVYRTMDRQAHFERVTKKAHERRMGKGQMVRDGWEWLYKAERDPSIYRPTSDLFLNDLSQIYGVLVGGKGERYGAEINGVRENNINREFQETPAYLALRSEKPLNEAIQEGLDKGLRSSAMRRAMGGGASEFQMAVWMKELTEIILLDYIFSQQDRVGNIDFKWYLYWVDSQGKVKSEKVDSDTARESMNRIIYPTEKDGSPTHLVQRTRVNDNDAGVRSVYLNRAKKNGWLENIFHVSPETYRKLQALDLDLQSKGPVYQYLTSNFTLPEKDITQIVTNTHEAAEMFRSTCRAGKLRFDLFGPKRMLEGRAAPENVNCN